MSNTTNTLTLDEVARQMECLPKRIAYNFRTGAWDRFIVSTNPYAIDPAILEKKAFYAIITGTVDRSKWPKSWTGFRGNRKAELRKLRKIGNREVLSVEPSKTEPANSWPANSTPATRSGANRSTRR